MKLKDKIIYSCLAASLLAGAIGVGVSMADSSEPLEVAAYTEGDSYEVLGTLKNYPSVSWTPGTGIPVEDEATIGDEANPQPAFSIELALVQGDEFKFHNVTADTWGNTASFEEYISGGGSGNFAVQVTGNYRITFNKHVDTWGGDASSAYNFEKLPDSETVTVSYIGPTGEVIETDEATVGFEHNTHFIFAEGYVNRGWYTDKDLTIPYTPQALETDTILYGKWEAAGEDTVIYYEGDYSYVYYWNNVSGGGNTFPGVQMEEVIRHWVSDATVYKAVIPAEYEATYVIFNNGSGGEGNQTADLPLEANSVYNNDRVDPLSDQKIASLDFLAYFDELRDEKGDICALRGDKEKLETLFKLYDALGENTALVDGLEDLGAYIYGEDGTLFPTEVTVGETMNYLALYLTPAVAEAAKVGSGNDGTAWIAVSILVGAAAAMGAGLYLAKKRKAAK